MKIFVALGTQPFPMDRILRELDLLVQESPQGVYDIFAQTGYSKYRPGNFSCQAFLPAQEYAQRIREADLLITHAGAGTMLSALSQQKRIIVCPRKKKLREHVDDHQQQLARKFQEMGCILVLDGQPLREMIDRAMQHSFVPYRSAPSQLPQLLCEFLDIPVPQDL